MAIPTGSPPILIGRPGTPVAVEIGVTVPAPELATYTVDPSGVAAMAYGPAPVVIRGPAVLVAVEIGVTQPISASATYSVFPSGVAASAAWSWPSTLSPIGTPAVRVAVQTGVIWPLLTR